MRLGSAWGRVRSIGKCFLTRGRFGIPKRKCRLTWLNPRRMPFYLALGFDIFIYLKQRERLWISAFESWFGDLIVGSRI